MSCHEDGRANAAPSHPLREVYSRREGHCPADRNYVNAFSVRSLEPLSTSRKQVEWLPEHFWGLLFVFVSFFAFHGVHSPLFRPFSRVSRAPPRSVQAALTCTAPAA